MSGFDAIDGPRFLKEDEWLAYYFDKVELNKSIICISHKVCQYFNFQNYFILIYITICYQVDTISSLLNSSIYCLIITIIRLKNGAIALTFAQKESTLHEPIAVAL
jgi:hypothetical protein